MDDSLEGRLPLRNHQPLGLGPAGIEANSIAMRS